MRSINISVVALVAASTLLQAVALLAGEGHLDAATTGRHAFSTIELLLVAGLLVQGQRIVRWARDTGQSPLTQRLASLCFYSLLLCGLGDIVNRNYLEQYYQFDDVIKHSYLVLAIFFFVPGYALIAVANRRMTQRLISRRVAIATVAAAAAAGCLLYLANHRPDVSYFSSATILVYTMLVCVLAGSALWLVKAYGLKASYVVVTGCLLVPVADALIGNFWIYRDHFPTIEHVNWILYFASLAMIQQIPFFSARVGASGEQE